MYAAALFLPFALVTALPEISIAKHRHRDAGGLRRRQEGTDETNVYDVITWSTGGAYYANGESLCLVEEGGGGGVGWVGVEVEGWEGGG